CRLRRGRIPLVQGHRRCRRLAASGSVRRRRHAASRRRRVRLHDGGAQEPRAGARSLAEARARGSPLARLVGSGRARNAAHAGRHQPLDRRQGPVVGAAAHRARLRGEVRPPAGRSLPPRDALPALAFRQAAEGLPLRSARGHDALRAEEGFRGRTVLTPPPAAASLAAVPLLVLPARFDGWTRVGSPGCLAYCGGQGASPWPSFSWRRDNSSKPSSEYLRSSIPRWRSPILAKRVGIVAIVKAAGSTSATSLQSRGAETRASGVGRIEYAPATVRSWRSGCSR